MATVEPYDGSCCVCVAMCMHVGPHFYCDRHRPEWDRMTPHVPHVATASSNSVTLTAGVSPHALRKILDDPNMRRRDILAAIADLVRKAGA